MRDEILEEKIFKRLWLYEQPRIDDTRPVDLGGYAEAFFGAAGKVRIFPEAPKYTVRIGKTEYDVHLRFSEDGTQNVLRQFRKMISG